MVNYFNCNLFLYYFISFMVISCFIMVYFWNFSIRETIGKETNPEILEFTYFIILFLFYKKYCILIKKKTNIYY